MLLFFWNDSYIHYLLFISTATTFINCMPFSPFFPPLFFPTQSGLNTQVSKTSKFCNYGFKLLKVPSEFLKVKVCPRAIGMVALQQCNKWC